MAITIRDISTAYEWIQKMLQYNFNQSNFENISKWLKDTWLLIQVKRDEWMKEKDLFAKFEVERNKIEKEVEKELKDKTAEDYQQKKTEELNKRMQWVVDPYMAQFIDEVTVDDFNKLEFKFQDNLPAYVNIIFVFHHMIQGIVIAYHNIISLILFVYDH